MIKLSTPQGVIAFDDGRWVAETTDLTTKLNQVDFTSLLPKGYVPYPNCAIAYIIADLLDGEVTDADALTYDPDLVY